MSQRRKPVCALPKTRLALASEKSQRAGGAKPTQPTSWVPTLGTTAPAASVVNVSVPNGCRNWYVVFGHNPLVTRTRIRPKVICSPATAGPLTKAPSRSRFTSARPGAVPAQPGVGTLDESAEA